MSRDNRRQSFELVLARLHLIPVFEKLGSQPSGIYVITVPATAPAETWMTSALRYVRQVRDALEPGAADVSNFFEEAPAGYDVDVVMLTDSGLDAGHSGARCTVYVTEFGHADMLHPTVGLADGVIRVDYDAALVVKAAAECGREISVPDALLLVDLPPRRRQLAIASGRTIRDMVERHLIARELEEAQEAQERAAEEAKKAKASKRVVPDVRPLEDLHGYGDAKLWGLELARDVEDWQRGDIAWSDVDNGVLLSGPPGCGKTQFAAALAKTLGAHFVAGSYSAWLGTGDGHQGDLLKSMRAAFEEARKNAPAVLLIDEVDNFVARGSIGHARSDEWTRGIVNGLLECLDGAVERQGVIVVGATNARSGIDPALLRPGRLDRHVAIPLPDEEARAAILAQHLGVGPEFPLGLFRRKTAGMSGADLERVARDARRIARREKVELRHSHIARALPRRVTRTAENILHISAHEVGHALVASVLGAEVQEVYVTRDRDPSEDADVAGAAIVKMRDGRRDAQWYSDQAAYMLGGLAAETVVYGSHGDGVGIDLAEATNVLSYALASMGMGDTLLSEGHREPRALAAARQFDPGLRKRVEDLLQEQAERARDIIVQHRQAFDELVERLVQRSRLDGAEVREVLSAYAPVQLSLAV